MVAIETETDGTSLLCSFSCALSSKSHLDLNTRLRCSSGAASDDCVDFSLETGTAGTCYNSKFFSTWQRDFRNSIVGVYFGSSVLFKVDS